jgi:hypothetical protein
LICLDPLICPLALNIDSVADRYELLAELSVGTSMTGTPPND